MKHVEGDSSARVGMLGSSSSASSADRQSDRVRICSTRTIIQERVKFDLDVRPVLSQVDCGNQNRDTEQPISQAQRPTNVWVDQHARKVFVVWRMRSCWRYVTS